MPHFEVPTEGGAVDEDPITFSLGGATFQAIPEVPVARIQRLVDEQQAQTGGLAAMVSFIEDVTVPAQRSELRRVLLDTTRPIPNTGLVELFLWLAKAYTQRAGGTVESTQVPTPSPESSVDRRLATVARWGEVVSG